MIPSTLLLGKNVLVGISGSISVYKTIELVRLLTKAGASVRVIMTQSAKRFVTSLTFETLTGHQVLDETSENWHSDHNHIGAATWAHAFVIAPATANTINKLAYGIADNLLTQTALAFRGIKIVAPAANTAMIHNPLTQEALNNLTRAQYIVMGTQTKELACKTQGDGALADPMELFYHTARILLKNDFWSQREVIVTGGGTLEAIDDVRYLSNYSSGKMASALALALFFKGSTVRFISTKFPIPMPQTISSIAVESTQEMLSALQNSALSSHEKRPFLFMAAAVSDYKPAHPKHGKLKKASLGSSWQLELVQNMDILTTLDRSHLTTIAFKAEMDPHNAHKNAQTMLDAKHLDGVCLNILEDKTSFGSASNTLDLITRGHTVPLGTNDKLTLAMKLLAQLESN